VKIGAWLVAEDRDRAYDGSQETPNPLQEKTAIRLPLLTIDVRVTEQFGIQATATIPDITRTAIVSRPAGVIHFEENFSGVGDTSVLGWYRFAPRNRWNIVLNAGASLPTGRTEVPRFRSELDEGSLVPVSRLQRGTGTFDPVLGANVDRRYGATSVFGSVAARMPLYENDSGLRTGASFEISGGAARELGHHRVVAFGRASWLHRQQDVFNGTPVLVGGGDWLYLTPGVGLMVGRGINVQAEVKVPVHRSLSNRQLDSRAIIQFGVSRAF
jgi:hypothetical protein